MSEQTPFIYKLNAMEHASQADHPDKMGYAAKREAVLAHVAALEAKREAAEQAAKKFFTAEMFWADRCRTAEERLAAVFEETRERCDRVCALFESNAEEDKQQVVVTHIRAIRAQIRALEPAAATLGEHVARVELGYAEKNLAEKMK